MLIKSKFNNVMYILMKFTNNTLTRNKSAHIVCRDINYGTFTMLSKRSDIHISL